MDYKWDDPINDTPLQSLSPEQRPCNTEEFIEDVEDDASDGFLDDSDTTESDDCSEWGSSRTTRSTKPTTSVGTEQDADVADEVAQAILAEIGVVESWEGRTSGGASSSRKKDPSYPYLNYFTKGDAGYTKFVEKYDIPEGVSVTLQPKGVPLTYGLNHLNVLLMAITRDGVRFPMNTFIWAMLNTYFLSPD